MIGSLSFVYIHTMSLIVGPVVTQLVFLSVHVPLNVTDL